MTSIFGIAGLVWMFLRSQRFISVFLIVSVLFALFDSVIFDFTL